MALSALGAVALLWGCAGELDKDPSVFTNAVNNGASTGGTASTTGGMAGTTGGVAGTTGGTGTTTGGSNGMIPPDDDCVAGVLSKNSCTVCHATGNPPTLGAGLVLQGTDLGKRLSTTKATYTNVTKNAAACVQGALIIDPEVPANSILLKKVTNTQVCGDSMPQGGVGLTGADLQCIQGWINKF